MLNISIQRWFNTHSHRPAHCDNAQLCHSPAGNSPRCDETLRQETLRDVQKLEQLDSGLELDDEPEKA